MIDSIIAKLYSASNCGLDIITYYYPEASKAAASKKGFKMRMEERDSSSHIKLFTGTKYGDVYMATDFGDDGRARSPIDIAMREEKINFSQAISLWADRLKLKESRISEKINRSDYKCRNASDKDNDGAFRFKEKPHFSEFELMVFGANVTVEVMHSLGWVSLESYELVSSGKIHCFKSNENYPIYLRKCPGEKPFYKLYQPYALPNKDGSSYKFAYYPKGTKPAHYVNGLKELQEAKEKNNDKLNCAIICSGERDAANCKAYGYHPIWLNSETDELTESAYYDIKKCVKTIYNIPDIDTTGRKRAHILAEKYIDIRTVRLPQWLSSYKDLRGKPCKDLRDYLVLEKSKKKLDELLFTAMPYQIWEWVEIKEEMKPIIKTSYFQNLLSCYGYGVVVTDSNTQTLVHRHENIVREVTYRELRTFLREFVEKNTSNITIWDLFKNSTLVKRENIEDLPILDIDFRNNTATSQILFFKNKTIEITSEKVTELRSGTYTTWENKIIPFNFRRIEPHISFENGYFQYKNCKSHFSRVIINTSRVHWRKEMEKRATGNKEEDEKYFQDNHFTLVGKRLTDDEKEEQLRNFSNKCFALGYLMHKYKDISKAWALWCIENELSTSDNKKGGGTGKTFTISVLKYGKIKDIVSKSGRDEHLTENRHAFERVDEKTDIILVDDAHKRTKLDFYLTMITGDSEVNPKQTKSKSLDFMVSPKVVFNGNFVPSDTSGINTRRLLYVVYSDWYHEKAVGSDYRESRKIYDDFGYNVCFGDSYKEEYWNEDINFLIDCLQFYLNCKERNIKVEPPMENIMKRINLAYIGENFDEWANNYFSPDGTNVNCEINKKQALTAYKEDSGDNKITANKFRRKLEAYCKNNGYILNPAEQCTHRNKENTPYYIKKSFDGSFVEYYFVKTSET